MTKTVSEEKTAPVADAASSSSSLCPLNTSISSTTSAKSNHSHGTTQSTASSSSTCSLTLLSNAEASSNRTNACAVRVGVRIRPLAAAERAAGGTSVLTVTATNDTSEIRWGEHRRFTYDCVFDEQLTQQGLYDAVSPPLLQSFLDGYNATIMAYGQTGSGKTFTMGSEAHTELKVEDSSNTGLIPRFMNQLFAEIQAKEQNNNADSSASSSWNYQLKASFLEVYGEDVHDLLVPHRPSVILREDANGGVVCTGLTHTAVANAAQALQVLHEGTLHRTTAATLMNLTSSRSHAIFTVTLTQSEGGCGGASGAGVSAPVTSTSRFTFVDLAGSERLKKTGAQGERAREGIKINEGLLALGNVINALADDEARRKHKRVHVPYRQSKLTRLLRDALGGNSQTLFLACVSPSHTNASETLSTLHYANRARNIKNAPVQNVDDAGVLELQRWQNLCRVLQAELLQSKFGSSNGGSNDEGNGLRENHVVAQSVDAALVQRQDVQAYLLQLQDAAQHLPQEHTKTKSSAHASLLMPATAASTAATMLVSPRRRAKATRGFSAVSAVRMPMNNTPTLTHKDKTAGDTADSMDVDMLDEVDPDEDMAILNQLLELQQRDQEFDSAQKQEDAKLKEVDSELAEQEGMLLQLRDSLKVYHNIKAKYEVLMAEVQQLETEKREWAQQLEDATHDPTRGCSAAIRQKLQKIEQSLARARDEARKHRQQHRQMEQVTQKCMVLEQKIGQLKTGRATLLKQQRAAATQHRAYTERKTREIQSLQRKERAATKHVSKLQAEVGRHKNNLEKRQVYIQKLQDKQKQTESHLMQLLSTRQRDLRRRTTTVGVGSKRRATQNPRALAAKPAAEMPSLAPTNQPQVQSLVFMLDKAVADRIGAKQLHCQYEERVTAYSEAMRQMVAAVHSLKDKRMDQEQVANFEQTVEDLEVKLELLGSEMEHLRAQMPATTSSDEEDDDASDDDNAKDGFDNHAVSLAIENQAATVVRTVLLNVLQKYATSEMDRQTLAMALDRKINAVVSLENEVDALNQRIAGMAKDLAQRNAASFADGGEDPALVLSRLREERESLSQRLAVTQDEKSLQVEQIAQLSALNDTLRIDAAQTNEKLAVLEAEGRREERAQKSLEILEKVQSIWKKVGVSVGHREEARQSMEYSLERTCARKLAEATALQQRVEDETTQIVVELEHMRSGLGIQATTSQGDDVHNTATLIQRRDELRRDRDNLKPTYEAALVRRAAIAKDARDLVKLLDIDKDQVSAFLQPLLLSSQKDDSLESNLSEAPSGSGSDVGVPINVNIDFLDACEQQLKTLRMKKSELLVRNEGIHKQCVILARDMKMAKADVLALVVENVKDTSNGELPTWWDTEIAASMANTVLSEHSVMRAAGPFTKHLDAFFDALSVAAKSRGELSRTLKDLVERAHKTLLATVEGELEANEAYDTFHEALFRLAPLSKEFIQACASEIEALVTGVEGMTQSEIEALTVVWEALDVSIADRGVFWGDLEDAIRALESKKGGPLDNVLQLAADGEGWVFDTAKEKAESFVLLETRLLKLDSIHKEVEKLRFQQDAKSKILSLDSEVRVINAQLAEFENTTCNKDRLLNRHTGSSNLLKEERFRKQMKAKFTAKLKQLASLIESWGAANGISFDSNLLSDDVRMLLDNPDKMGSIIQQRQEFMHLRTVKSKRKAKRSPDGEGSDNSVSPPSAKKRMLTSSRTSAKPASTVAAHKTDPVALPRPKLTSLQSASRTSTARPIPVRNVRAAASERQGRKVAVHTSALLHRPSATKSKSAMEIADTTGSNEKVATPSRDAAKPASSVFPAIDESKQLTMESPRENAADKDAYPTEDVRKHAAKRPVQETLTNGPTSEQSKRRRRTKKAEEDTQQTSLRRSRRLQRSHTSPATVPSKRSVSSAISKKAPLSPYRGNTTKKKPLSPLRTTPQKQRSVSKPAASKNRMVLPPFGHVLEQDLSPRSNPAAFKENSEIET